jgi:hypothetical protein
MYEHIFHFVTASENCIVLQKILNITRQKPVTLYCIHILIEFVSFMISHITWTLFALRTLHSKFCEDDLLLVNWPKHVVKVKIKIKTYIVVFETICFLLFLSIIVMVSLTPVSVAQSVKPCLEAVRKAIKSFGQTVGLLTTEQLLPWNICKTELQSLIFQNKSQNSIFFTLAATLLLPYTSCVEKTDLKRYPYQSLQPPNFVHCGWDTATILLYLQHVSAQYDWVRLEMTNDSTRSL